MCYWIKIRWFHIIKVSRQLEDQQIINLQLSSQKMEPHVTTFDSEGDGLVNADDPEPAFSNLMEDLSKVLSWISRGM